MKSECLTQKLSFDLTQLLPGRAVQLISAPHNIGEEPRKQTAIVKDVSYFSITLLFVKMDKYDEEDNFNGKVEEKRFPADAFEGVGCYQLKRLFTEDELKAKQD